MSYARLGFERSQPRFDIPPALVYNPLPIPLSPTTKPAIPVPIENTLHETPSQRIRIRGKIQCVGRSSDKQAPFPVPPYVTPTNQPSPHHRTKKKGDVRIVEVFV